VPCETQAPITTLYAPPSGPLKQVGSSLSAPGAQERWKSAAMVAIDSIRSIVSQQGVKLSLSDKLKAMLGK